ncbi:hypothetical protein PG990_013455 [Apiospora arundinis]|uniref:Uncharacterized protein n=1 Tax=Apiospora arundinis TaxID=335852 RepID=A0ABR2IAW4_9PEZI
MAVASTLATWHPVRYRGATGSDSPTMVYDSSPTASGNSTVPNQNTASSNITPGAIAGATIGGFLGGLLIGLALMVFLYRGRKPATSIVNKRKSRGRSSGQTRAEPRRERALPVSVASPGITSQLEATPDKEIVEEYRNIFKLVEQHVDNFYHDHPVEVDAGVYREATKRLPLVFNDRTSREALVALLLEPHSRAAAIRYVISEFFVRSIDFHSPRRMSLLPLTAVELMRGLPAAERGTGNAEMMGEALHRWRTLTAYLMQPHRSHRLPLVPSEDDITPRIGVLTSDLNEFLQPFISTDESFQGKQGSHLRAIAFEYAKFGYLLFSQPCEWQFIHEYVLSPEALLLHAGLQKSRRENGEKCWEIVENPVIDRV